MMTSLNDDITLKISITLYYRKHFHNNQNLFLNSQTYTVNDIYVVIKLQLSQCS